MAVSQEAKLKAAASLGAILDKELIKQVSSALGPTVEAAKVALLNNALKLAIRSKVGGSLGVSGGAAAGGIGGTAGGGTNLSVGSGSSAGYAGGVSGKVGGVATGGLSLGAGLGTRASTPGTKLGAISFGESGGGSFGVGAQVGFQDKTAAISPGMAVDIQVSVLASLEQSLIGAGISLEERSQLLAELEPSINSAVGDSFNSAFGPELGYAHASGTILLTAEITMKRRGAWKGIVVIDEKVDGAETPSGPFVFDIDGVEFRCTILPDRSGAWAGRVKLRVVGGSGGLSNTLSPRNYAGGTTRFKTVLDDILRDSGEVLSDESDSTFLNKKLDGWQRVECTAEEALDLLCDNVGAEWRVLRDGKIWVGVDTWPEVEPAGTVKEADWGDGVITVLPDFATLVPGIIVRRQQINQIVYYLSRKGLVADLYAKSTSDLLSKQSERANKGFEYAKRYRCSVVTQNGDGTVDVLVDDSRAKGKGIGKCRVRVGIPGTKLTVPKGARCLVGWDDADPQLPYVDSWESSSKLTMVEVGTGAVAVAQAGGTVQALLPPTLMITGTITPGPPPAPAAAFVGVITIPQPLLGVIQGGSSALKAGS